MCNLISRRSRKGIVVEHPVPHNDGLIVGGAAADDHPVDTGVYYHALAHGAGVHVVDQFPAFGLTAGKIHGGAYHLVSRGAYNGVRLGVNRTAELISLASRDLHFLPEANSEVDAVFTPSRRAGISGGNDLVVFDDYGAEIAAKAGAPLENGLGNVKIIIVFIGSLHIRSSSFKPKGALHFGKL